VQRQIQRDVVTEAGERLGETAGHVGEATHLRVRGGLGGREDDLHEPPDVNEM
jgi:hypothetical protein